MKPPRKKPRTKFTNIDGNAFAIVHAVSAALKKEGADQEYIDQYKEKALADDYDTVLRVSIGECEVC